MHEGFGFFFFFFSFNIFGLFVLFQLLKFFTSNVFLGRCSDFRFELFFFFFFSGLQLLALELSLCSYFSCTCTEIWLIFERDCFTCSCV